MTRHTDDERDSSSGKMAANDTYQRAKPPPHYRISFADLRWLFVLIIAGISWGLKLEFSIASQIARVEELNRLEHVSGNSRIAWLEQQVAAGVLPRADERISRLEEEHNELHQRLRDLEEALYRR